MGKLAFPFDPPAANSSQNLCFILIMRGEFPPRLQRRIEAISHGYRHPEACVVSAAAYTPHSADLTILACDSTLQRLWRWYGLIGTKRFRVSISSNSDI